jgi:hypothetical protein
VSSYNVNSPVLFLVFNRLNTTIKVFDAIREVKPSRLYISSDGPRLKNDSDVSEINAVRDYVLANIDWDCEVKTLFRESNLGCKDAVSSGISWFFENEDEGIILEDDCLPNQSFFRFCDSLLNKYRLDERVRHISGVNFIGNDIVTESSYYFSRFTHVWGWASWKRVWKDYDKNLDLLDRFLNSGNLWNIYPDKRIIELISKELIRVRTGELNTWDFQYLFLNLIQNGLTIIPCKSLVENIGFGVGATHDHTDGIKMHQAEELSGELIHPDFLVPQIRFDIDSIVSINNLSIGSKLKYKISSYYNKLG